MNINDFKGLKKVYGIPWGNNAIYHSGKDHIAFDVIKVKRIYIEMRQEGYKRTVDLDANGKTKDDCNAGYKFFPVLEELKNYKSKKEKCAFIGARLRFEKNFMRLSDELIDKIMEEIKE